jgi:hypothetical protein
MIKNSSFIQGMTPVTLVDLNRRIVTQTHPYHQFRLLRCEYHQALLYKLLRIRKSNLWNTQETLFQTVKDPSSIVRRIIFEAMRLPEALVLPYITISLRNIMARTYTLVKYVEGLENQPMQYFPAPFAQSAYSQKESSSSASGSSNANSASSKPDLSSSSGGMSKTLVPHPSNAYYSTGPSLPAHSDPYADMHFKDSHTSGGYHARGNAQSGNSIPAGDLSSRAHETLAHSQSDHPSTTSSQPEQPVIPVNSNSLTSIFASPPPNLFYHHHHHLYQHNHSSVGPQRAHNPYGSRDAGQSRSSTAGGAGGMGSSSSALGGPSGGGGLGMSSSISSSSSQVPGLTMGDLRSNPSILKRVRHDLDLDEPCFTVLLGIAETIKPGIFRALFGDPMSQEKKWIELFEGL